MKLAIVGSRDFNDFDLLEQKIKENYCLSEITEIISGGASGADTLAEDFADKYKIKKTIFEAKWELYGKSAGMKRNILIIKNCTNVIAFWDGKSKGTENAINLALKNGKTVKIIYF